MTRKIHAFFNGNVFFPEEPVKLENNGRYILNIEPAKKMARQNENQMTKNTCFTGKDEVAEKPHMQR